MDSVNLIFFPSYQNKFNTAVKQKDMKLKYYKRAFCSLNLNLDIVMK